MTDYITPSDYQMLESNLQSVMASILIIRTTPLINIAVWY